MFGLRVNQHKISSTVILDYYINIEKENEKEKHEMISDTLFNQNRDIMSMSKRDDAPAITQFEVIVQKSTHNKEKKFGRLD